VVISEGRGGLKDSRERGYGAFLARHGCAAPVIESFRSRGVEHHGDALRALKVTESMLLSDAFAGLAWLAGRPDLDPARSSARLARRGPGNLTVPWPA
jgi:dienelactone hydrolase